MGVDYEGLPSGHSHHLPPSGKVTSYGASSDLTLLMAGASFSDDAAW